MKNINKINISKMLEEIKPCIKLTLDKKRLTRDIKRRLKFLKYFIILKMKKKRKEKLHIALF